MSQPWCLAWCLTWRLACWLAAGLIACSGDCHGQAKMRVLLDTDAFNEIDDQFFIAYSFFERRFDIEGVNAAQYRWENGSVDESYYEIIRILELMRLQPKIPIVRGADFAMRDEKSPLRSPATELIRSLAMKNDPRPLYVLAVGALTNVASALVLYPEIKPKIRVVWLGGFPPDGRIVEFNAANDRAAVKAVFESGADLTVVPTETCARYLTLPLSEARARLRHTNALGRYLLGLVRDYGERNKVIWDISVAAYAIQVASGKKFFDIEEEPAPVIDLGAARYNRRQGPHKIKICTNANRDGIFADLFRHFPQSVDKDPPFPISALASGDGREVRVWFSEPMKPFHKECFQLADAPLDDVQTVDDQTAVVRTLRRPGEGADLTVSCGEDVAGNGILPERKSIPVRTAAGMRPGLRLRVYPVERGLKEIPQPAGEPVFDGPVSTLVWPDPALPQEVRPKPDAATLLTAEGYVYLPMDHRYELDLVAHRLARVYLYGRMILDQGQDGDRRAHRVSVKKSGLYPIRIEQYVEPGRFDLTLQWNLPFHDMSAIPDAAFVHP